MSSVTAASLERVELTVGDGTTMAAHVARPAKGTKHPPGIIVGQDAFGVTNFLRDVVVRFADLGFVAIAPELYHRSGDNVVISYDDREMVGNQKHMKAMTPEGMIADAEACYAWLLAEGDVPADRAALMGFCMGGRLAYLANSRIPLKAAISLYGRVGPPLYKYAATQHGELMQMWGGRDHEIPPEHYRGIADALTAAGAKHTQVVFSHAPHAFFCHVRPWCYDPDASRQAWAMSLELLRHTGVLRSD